ncbi:hypothetical protein ACWGRJ_46375, partial [Bradyrhizobium sp. Lot11]
DLVGLTKRDNVASLIHGVLLSLREVLAGFDTRLDPPPISVRHHPVSRIALLDRLLHHSHVITPRGA